MNKSTEKSTRKMPKGGRKGGSVFPRMSLADAVPMAKKLVSKTHTGPQSRDVIYSGVVGAKAGRGDTRISALKQYGFLKGDMKSGLTAGDLAKKLSSAPQEELKPLLQQAALRPNVFKSLFDTFHGDSVSRAKLKQRAADLDVHPDETGTCVDLYVASMTMAGLATADGEQVKHLASSEVGIMASTNALQNAPQDQLSDNEQLDTSGNGSDIDNNSAEASPNQSDEKANQANASLKIQEANLSPRAIFNVNITLDSSLDTEKLLKQLEILKKFGAI